MLSRSEITHYTNLWCRQKGIYSRDLESHPRADDVVLLIKLRDDLWDVLDASDRAVWSAYWGWAYHKAFALKKKHLTKLEKIIQGAILRQQRHQTIVEKIKALKREQNQKRLVNNLG